MHEIILIAGAAGQGINTLTSWLVKLYSKLGYEIFSSSELMSRIRGGLNSTQIEVSDKKISSIGRKVRVFISLKEEAAFSYKQKCDDKTIIIEAKWLEMIAKEANVSKLLNTVAFGVYLSTIMPELNIGNEILDGMNNISISQKEENKKALEVGFEKGKEKFSMRKVVGLKRKMTKYMDGALAVSIGALFGGCNYIASYPMSPATKVLVNLTKMANDYDVLAEQAEDEIAAINMALGASYAGGRAMVTTSGGGFALMEEGVSLAGATETPVVVHVASRPGPATGMPTRTEQADFSLVRYAGHGDFERIILAPGDVGSCIMAMNDAFIYSEKYQIPVFVLTDQYLMDATMSYKKTDIEKPIQQEFIYETNENYKRYELTPSGISKRGIPSYGEGVVCVDSDEHDEEGKITESSDMRVKMVNKRMKRREEISLSLKEPILYGAENYKKLVICYGSTLGIAKDLEETAKENDTAFLHFTSLYPLSFNIYRYFRKAAKLVLLENNYIGQFGNSLEQQFRIMFDQKILKYDGHMFTRDSVIEELFGKKGVYND